MMCNRRLGITPANTVPTRQEYDTVAAGIKQREDGWSRNIDIWKYYAGKGYCVSYQTLRNLAGTL